MKIVFVSNYINHHQVPIAEEFYRLTDRHYKFVATEPIPKYRLDLGYPDYADKPYLIKAYASEEQRSFAMSVINRADVVMVGSAPEAFVKERIRSGKLTFRYSERWFKSKKWWQTGPRGWLSIFLNHVRYKNKPLYMLAASAYTANDLYQIGLYKDKIFKWGYFTAAEAFDFEASLVSKRGIVRIMWCARFLSWKHPELPVLLAKRLKDKGYSFELNMYGNGEEMARTEDLIAKLGVDDVVNLCGSLSNAEILQQMRKHNIFLFTSDRNEGWGAVLNEAMSNACAVVSSDRIGATPFLIEDGKNGFIFESENLDSLYEKTKTLIDDLDLREGISRAAYKTIHELWSPANAAANFMKLAQALLGGIDCKIEKGPCSKAYPVK